MRRQRTPGFTLVEMAVVLAIITVLSALAFDSMRRSTPRMEFNGFAAELQSLTHEARQQALAEGVQVAVMFFPNYPNTNGSTGRIIVLQDDTSPTLSLFTSSAPLNFTNYNPANLAWTANGKFITYRDLPYNVQVGPTTGLGQPNLPFPYNNIPVNVACSFCNSAGDNRGAIVFDYRGRSTFYNQAGVPIQNLSGGSISVYTTALGTGVAFTTDTLVVTSPYGSIMSFNNG